MTEGTSPLPASFGASLSPDGTAVAHIVDEGGYPRAVQRFLDGTDVSSSRYVTLPIEGPIIKIIHSPDGHWLAAQTAPRANEHSQVWVVTTDPDDPRAIWVYGSDTGTAELVGWDGDLLAINIEGPDGVGESRLVDPATGHVTVLDRRPQARLLDSWAGTALVRVGPRGQRWITLLRAGREVALFAGDPGATTDPAVVLDDHRPRRLLNGMTYAPVAFDPAEVFEGYVRILARSEFEADRACLLQATVTPAGASYRVVARRLDADLDAFVVSDDLSRIAVLWNVDGGRSALQVVEFTDGTLRDPVPLPGPVASDLSISADGSILAVTVEGPGCPRCVGLIEPAVGRWVPIEPPIVQAAVTPTLERLTARDGLVLSGWLYRAPGQEGPGPVVLDFHGGPEGQARPAYSDIYPVLLRAGITVFAPNVRGSGGFGRAFSHADDGERRPEGIGDVADIAEYVVSSGIADPQRLAISGRSYGGYLTLICLALYPDLFVTGISTCGMSDLCTFYRDTEPWIGAAAISKYGDPATDADLLDSLSPMRYVDRITKPLLTIHGTSDTNVPPTESVQIVEALSARGVQAECVLVEGEGHVFTQPENRLDLAVRTRDWLLAAFAEADFRGSEGSGDSADAGESVGSTGRS